MKHWTVGRHICVYFNGAFRRERCLAGVWYDRVRDPEAKSRMDVALPCSGNRRGARGVSCIRYRDREVGA